MIFTRGLPFLPSLLTLWIELGGLPKVHHVLMEGMETVPKNTWLQVFPQLIACIDFPKDLVESDPQPSGGHEQAALTGGSRGEERGGGREDCLPAGVSPGCGTVRAFLLSLLHVAGNDLSTDSGSQVGWPRPHRGCQPDPQQPVGPLQPAGAAGEDGV